MKKLRRIYCSDEISGVFRNIFAIFKKENINFFWVILNSFIKLMNVFLLKQIYFQELYNFTWKFFLKTQIICFFI